MTEKQKTYYEANKDLLKNKSKIYRQEYKEEIAEQRKIKYQLNMKNLNINLKNKKKTENIIDYVMRILISKKKKQKEKDYMQ